MAGHSRWTQIKHQKQSSDQKRGELFAKLLSAITIAARDETNPEFNPRLRTAIEKAHAANVPQINIARAVERAADKKSAPEEVLIEAYGPGGVGILVVGATDNKNRTIAEVRHLLDEHGAKWADAGSVQWAFKETQDDGSRSWRAKFAQSVSAKEHEELHNLVDALLEHPDVQGVFTAEAQ